MYSTTNSTNSSRSLSRSPTQRAEPAAAQLCQQNLGFEACASAVTSLTLRTHPRLFTLSIMAFRMASIPITQGLRYPIHQMTRNASRSMTVLSKQSAEEYKKQNYSQRMDKTGRPVSPHVTIYSFPASALTSITNRVTGVALSFGAAGVACVELLGGNGAAVSLLQDVTAVGPLVASSVKFSVAFPFIYHYLGGLRHLMWDYNPELLTNVDVQNASYILVGSSLVLSAGVSIL